MKKLFSSIVVSILLLTLVQSCNKDIVKELTIVTFNVWQEGTSVPNGLEKVHNIIIATDPDVVCFVEVRNYKEQDWTTKIVEALAKSGKKYYRGYVGGDVSFISKYPLEDGKEIFGNSDKGTVVNFNLNVDGNSIVIAGAHLDYTYYASNLPRGYNGGDPNWEMMDDGQGNPLPNIILDSVLKYNLKSTRDEAIASFISSVKSETRPIVLMGDFNEPSFLDWTEKTKNRYDHHGAIIPWHSTEKLYKQGFVDVYRTFYPDEITHPGFTWPSYAHEKESTSWAPLADERDRVDYIFFKSSDIEIEDVFIVGPKESYVYDKLEIANTSNEKFMVSDLPWPSDHKAVGAKLLFTFHK